MSQSVGLALATERIPFATAIAPIYAQSTDEFAQNAAYLHEVSGGRFQFGIGIAHAPAYVRMEVKPGKPLGAFVPLSRSSSRTPNTGRCRRSSSPRCVSDHRPLRRDRRGSGLRQCQPCTYGRIVGHPASGEARRSGFLFGNRIRTCISDDVDEAKAVLRKTMAHYWAMPNYRNYWKEAGYLDEMTAAEAGSPRAHR